MTSSPLSTEARRFVRVARQEIAAVRSRGLAILGAPSLDEARHILIRRLGDLGATRRAEALRGLLSRLQAAQVPVCKADDRGRRRVRFDLLLPDMDGHPIVEEEPSSITIEGLRVQAGRSSGAGVEGALVWGSVTAHALGRFAERTSRQRLDTESFLRSVCWASYLIARMPFEERSIYCRIGTNAVLAGVTRIARQRSSIPWIDGQLVQLADWRTVLQRDWLTPEEDRFSESMLKLILGGEWRADEWRAVHESLPLLPARPDYISERLESDL